jgi:predicted kinase
MSDPERSPAEQPHLLPGGHAQKTAQEVIVLNGPAGVGKSTVSQHLRELVPGTVAISGDALRSFVPGNARDFLGGGSTYRAAAALTNAYLAMAAPRIVFDYVFSHPAHIEYYCKALGRTDVAIYLFTLWAPLELVVARELARPGRDRLAPAVVHECHAEIAENLERLGHVIENIDRDACDVAGAIHDLVTAGTGRLSSENRDLIQLPQ